MNLPIAKALKLAGLAGLICLPAGALFAQSRPVDPGLTAHEWGTFTSVAGSNGQAVEWLPANGPDELPSFVEHLHSVVFKQGLPATVRMETPVLYFYSSHHVTLSVHVTFSKGLITEWYPHAEAPVRDGGLDDAALYRKHAANGSISWDSVTLQPGLAADFPRDLTLRPKLAADFSRNSPDNDNHYYAARQTSATSLRVHAAAGDQYEKFLFYRGVSFFSVPVSAKFTAEGNLLVRNSLEEGISNIIWFERRGDRVGYRIREGLQNEAEAILEPPALTATVESLYGDLEEMLVVRGLYRDEAHAMVETWRNSWLEEGSRLFYIVPARFVDTILPLTITPAPEQTVRVFVGRLELVSPATEKAVATALASNDNVTLAKYGRFLEPILKIITEKNAADGKQLREPPNAPCDTEVGSFVVKQQR